MHTHTHTHTHEYYLATKKEENRIICRDEDGPSICQSEVSQKEKKKLYINTYMQVILNIMKQWLELCIDTNCMTLQILCV